MSWPLASIAFATLMSCHPSASTSFEPATPSGECLLFRNNPSGVIGMDVGASVSLGGGRSLFIFGDTFLGSFNANGSRNASGAVHSSVAIVEDAQSASCFSGTAFLSDAGAVEQILDPTEDMAWPLGPAMVDGGGLALLYTWVKSDSSQPLGFDTLGNGIVSGALGSPISLDVAALSAPATEAMPAAWLVHDGYAYLYRCGTQVGPGFDPCVVGRAPAASLAVLAAYQYFVAGAGYTGSYAEATIVTEGTAAFSVTYNAYLSAYLELYVEPFAPWVSVRTASAPEGPFSSKLNVWPCSLPADDPNAYCYAAFEHPQLDSASGRRVAFSYSTNSTKFASMLSHPNVNWPRLASVDLADAGVVVARVGVLR